MGAQGHDGVEAQGHEGDGIAPPQNLVPLKKLSVPRQFEAEVPPEPFERPLPSIDLPILRSERGGLSLRKGALWLLLSIGLMVLLTLGFRFFNQTQTSTTPAVTPVASPPHTATVKTMPPALLVDDDRNSNVHAATALRVEDETTGIEGERIQFGGAKSFHSALSARQIDEADIKALENALRGKLDFRRCQASDEMIIFKDDTGKLSRFEYHSGVVPNHPNPLAYFVATRNAEGAFRVTSHKKNKELIRKVGQGTVSRSLGAAFDEAGLGKSLVSAFVQTFSGKINFATDVRKGDSFRLLYEEARSEGIFLGYGRVLALEYDGRRVGMHRVYLFAENKRKPAEYFTESGRAIRSSFLSMPCQYDRVSSKFDMRRMHPILKRIMPHNGVDFAASTGTPVVAAADGVVIWAGPKGPNGNLVGLRHANGYDTYYAHLHRIQRGINKGVEVKANQRLGTVGSTGRSTAPHLHFGLKKRGRFIDPLGVLNGPGRQLSRTAMARFQTKIDRYLREMSRSN